MATPATPHRRRVAHTGETRRLDDALNRGRAWTKLVYVQLAQLMGMSQLGHLGVGKLHTHMHLSQHRHANSKRSQVGEDTGSDHTGY
eukprot:107421-Chlamydomonas_euryale.AAC.6